MSSLRTEDLHHRGSCESRRLPAKPRGSFTARLLKRAEARAWEAVPKWKCGCPTQPGELAAQE